MNLSQIVATVKDNLSTGGGENIVMSIDTFWSNAEIITYVNRGYRKVANAIRRARSEHFVRRLVSTDSTIAILGQNYDPSSLKMIAGVGEYILPPDFIRLVGIWSVDESVRFQGSTVSAQIFKDIYNLGESTGIVLGTMLYDIVGTRMLVVRPKPVNDFDTIILYEKALEPLSEYRVGVAAVITGSVNMGFGGADLSRRFKPGDEVMLGTATVDPIIDVSETYSVIKSVDVSLGKVILEHPYKFASAFSPGVKYVRANVPEIPFNHHDAIVYYATYQGFMKGTNPNQESANSYHREFKEALADIIGDVEERHYQDMQFSQAYLEDE